MTLTIKSIAAYLGHPASVMLSDPPFKDWEFERSVDSDLDEPVIDYVFRDDGLDFVCDEDESVATIFLHSDEDRVFDEDLSDLPMSSSRRDVIERLGSPSKKGGGFVDPILGEFGAWDRFSQSEYTIHVEYRVGQDRIRKLSFMRNDVVP